jgi:hypothetical protein
MELTASSLRSSAVAGDRDTIEVLARRKKEQPGFDREPGVGKTAIVEGLAQRMVAGEVPETLREQASGRTQHHAMVAGRKYRGEFEERVQKVPEVTEHQATDSLIDECTPSSVQAGRRRRRAGRGQRVQADDGARRTEPDRRYHAQRVSEYIEKDGRAGARIHR